MRAKTKPGTIAQVAPELRPRVRLIPRVPVGSAWGRWLIRSATRLLALHGPPAGVHLETRTTSGGVVLRIFTPKRAPTGAALLWIHGGGMVIGSAAQDDPSCAAAARVLGIVVVATEYRLAPEHPFPAALDDCHAAWTWLQAVAAQRGIARTRIAIGGGSAGGGLAAGLVQRLRDEGGVQPAAQWLFCPMLDDRTAARHELDAIGHVIWDNRQNRHGWRAYLGVEPGAAHAPAYAAPARREDLRGLPPAWIGTGDIELFCAENCAYAARLQAAGVDCTLDVVRGAPHGFENFAPHTQLAQAYLARAHAWLGTQLQVRSP